MMRKISCMLALASCASAGFAGCESPPPAGHSSVKSFLPANAVPTNLHGFSSEEIKRASNLYNAKCARCHKFYDPAAYNDAEWQKWMAKMSKKSHLQPDQVELLSRYLEGFRKTAPEERSPNPAKP
jgi:hypothetical protein